MDLNKKMQFPQQKKNPIWTPTH